MSDLFKDVIPAILQTKKQVVENDSDYNAFIVNRALSFHLDCVMAANQMNMVPSLDGILQNHFLLNTVRARKRPFQKWQKLEQNETLELIKEYYNYSNEKAKAVLMVLNDEQINVIRKNLNKGGLNAKSKHKGQIKRPG